MTINQFLHLKWFLQNIYSIVPLLATAWNLIAGGSRHQAKRTWAYQISSSSKRHRKLLEPRLLRCCCCHVLGRLQVALRQDVLESVPLLCQLPDPHLQLVVLVLQLLGPLLGQQDSAAGLVPALPHRDVVPLPAQPVLGAVLVDAALAGCGAQGRQQEGRELLGRTQRQCWDRTVAE